MFFIDIFLFSWTFGFMTTSTLSSPRPLKPEFTMFLGREVTRQLASLGSVFAERLAKYEAWCMVAWKDEGVASEVLTTIQHEDGAYTKEASPMSLHLIIPRRRREWQARGCC